MKEKVPGPSVARRLVRAKLRQARQDSGKTQQEVATSLDWSTSKLLRIENGHVAVQTSDLMALLMQYGVNGDEADRMVDLVRTSRQPTISSRYRDVMSPEFNEWLEFEEHCSHVRQYETKLIPGVLQVYGYSWSIVKQLSGRADDDYVERVVQARMERAEKLTRRGGPSMAFIIDEGALRRGVGNEKGRTDFAVIKRVLSNIKRLNTIGRAACGEAIEDDLNPAISVRIVPFEVGAYPAFKGPFELLEFEDPNEDNMLYLEHASGDIVIRETRSETAPYLEMFDEMESLAPSAAQTNGLIDIIIELMESGKNGIPSGRVL
jgi:transcriptional regulator with XRE-family HTH domain